MNGQAAENKSGVSFAALLLIARRLLTRKRLPTVVITILLSVFSFTFFALFSTAFLYDYPGMVVRGYRNIQASSRSYAYASQFTGRGNGDTSLNVSGFVSVEDLLTVGRTVGREHFVYDLRPIVSDSVFTAQRSPIVQWEYFVGDSHYLSGGNLEDKADPLASAPIASAAEVEKYSDLYGLNAAGGLTDAALAGSEEDYESIGFRLLAGRFPVGENEVAISEAHFESFCRRGYVDAAQFYVPSEYGLSFSREDWVDDRDDLCETIEDYGDILNKTIGYGVVGEDEGAASYTIVGVVDTHYDEIPEHADSDLISRFPSGRWMFSESWAEGREYVISAFCAPIEDDASLRACAKMAIAHEDGNSFSGLQFPILVQMILLTGREDVYGLFVIILAIGGIFFGVFASLLTGHLTSRMMAEKERKVGVLRSLGAGRGAVRMILLTETVLMATIIFLLTLCTSLGLYYGWLYPLLVLETSKVHFLVYNGWTVLILAALCYGVPLLCSLVPLQKFLNKTIVQNLTGSMEKPRKRKRRVRQ